MSIAHSGIKKKKIEFFLFCVSFYRRLPPPENQPLRAFMSYSSPTLILMLDL